MNGWSPRHGQTELLTPALEFLEIPIQKWTGIIEATVLASVELAHIIEIRFSTSSQNSIASSTVMTRNRHTLLMRTS